MFVGQRVAIAKVHHVAMLLTGKQEERSSRKHSHPITLVRLALTAKIMAGDCETRIVPGHGPFSSRNEVELESFQKSVSEQVTTDRRDRKVRGDTRLGASALHR